MIPVRFATCGATIVLATVSMLIGMTSSAEASICFRDNPCQNGGQCVSWGRADRFFCRCTNGYSGKTCTQKDPCKEANPCQNKGKCWSYRLFGSWKTQCRCKIGYHGRFCEKEYTNICTREKPCMNGGRCRAIGRGHGYKCYCPRTHTGVNCTEADPCLAPEKVCLNGGTCRSYTTDRNTWRRYCRCSTGFTGNRCETEYSSACDREKPCKNGGVCRENPWNGHGYECACPRTHTGVNCTKEHICFREKPCKNGATCRREDWQRHGYTCQCPRTHAGVNCTIADPCLVSKNICLNRGECRSIRISGYTWQQFCRCLPGFEGKRCEIEPVCLREKPCKNGGTCRSSVISRRGYECLCPRFYAGDNCMLVDPCLTTKNFCLNGGRCRSSLTRNNTWHQRCDCRNGFQGKRCEIGQGCQRFKCYNGGTCYSFSPEHARCSCTPGYRGRHCEQEICSIDASRCRVTNRKPLPTNFTKCREYTQQLYQNETTCLQELYQELVAKKDCACTQDDVTRLLFSTLNTDPTLHVAWHCITQQPALNQPECAKGTVECGKALIEAYRYQSPVCNRTLWETANRCYQEFKRGQLPLAGCSAYQYFFKTFGLTGKLSMDMICSECDIYQKILPCVMVPNRKTNDMCDYFVASRINATVECFSNNIRKDVKCTEVANDALIFAIEKMKVTAHNTRCEQARKYGEMRHGWGCDKPMPSTNVH